MFSTRRSSSFAALIAVAVFASQAVAQSHDHPAAPEAPSAEALQAFRVLKSLAGGYQGPVTEPANKVNTMADVALRVTSMGNVLVHELKPTEDTDSNPLKGQHPVTAMYMDGGKLLLTHYCDSGNRPRMTGRISTDGKVLDFDFLDVVGPLKYGHMQRARFTIIDPTHHIEDWTWENPDGKTVTAHFDLRKVAEYATISGK
jgi:hypothetical protein